MPNILHNYLSSFSIHYLSVALVFKLRQTIQLKEPARQREKQNISPTDFPGQLCWRHVHRLHPSVFVSVLFVEDWVIIGNQVWLMQKPEKCSTEMYGGQINTETMRIASYWNPTSDRTLSRDELEMNSLRDPLTFRDKQTESCQKIVVLSCPPKIFAFMEKCTLLSLEE